MFACIIRNFPQWIGCDVPSHNSFLIPAKTKDNKYYNDNFDIQKPFYEWSYTFDENTIKLDQIKEIGWAANNSYGSTYVSNFSLKNKKFKLYEY